MTKKNFSVIFGQSLQRSNGWDRSWCFFIANAITWNPAAFFSRDIPFQAPPQPSCCSFFLRWPPAAECPHSYVDGREIAETDFRRPKMALFWVHPHFGRAVKREEAEFQLYRPSVIELGRLRYVEKILTARSQQYAENRSLHNVEFLQTLHNKEKLSQQYMEKVA